MVVIEQEEALFGYAGGFWAVFHEELSLTRYGRGSHLSAYKVTMWGQETLYSLKMILQGYKKLYCNLLVEYT